MSIVLVAVMGTLAQAGVLDATVAAGYTTLWAAALEGLGRLIRGDVYSAATVEQIVADERRRRLDLPEHGDRPDGFGVAYPGDGGGDV